MTIHSAHKFGSDLRIIHDDDSETFLVYTGNGFWQASDSTGPVGGEFRFPFPRGQHTTYEGHSGADWPGGVVGNTANVRAIGAGVVEDVYSLTANTWGEPGGSLEPFWRGCCVVVNHGVIGGIEIWSLYAHLRDAPSFSEGDPVAAGQVIGRVGNSGFSNGAHLHFEVIYDGVRLSTGEGGYERTIGWMDANAEGSWT